LLVGVYCPDISTKIEVVPFLLDTGCSATVLHPVDATSRFGLQPSRLTDRNQWHNTESMGGVGGSSACYVVPAQYGFLHTDGHLQIIPGQVRIAEYRADNQTLPSLLGWDILQHFRATLDGLNLTIVLESAELATSVAG
jgi:hypothetical protein